MVETHDHFEQRLKSLEKKHQKMNRGYGTRVSVDGLITVVPKRHRRGFPWKLTLMFILGFIGFKALMVASVGPVTYNARLAKLEHGTLVEQAGARVLSIDPVTDRIVHLTGPVLR